MSRLGKLAGIQRVVRRAARAGPRATARRLGYEWSAEVERFRAPRRARRFGGQALLRATGDSTLDAVWQRMSTVPYPAITVAVEQQHYEAVCPGDTERIMRAAERAARHQVDLLGSGPIELGERIDWHQDYKTGYRWQPEYMRSTKIVDLDNSSDVKFPWELSRLHWLIPAGQAYLLTGDERHAVLVRDVLEHWITENPYAASVNWTCTMEVALRILTWTWFFHVFHASDAWADPGFRERFLCTLYLHGDFTDRHVEYSDVNGNHCTTDAAGLVFVGLAFGAGSRALRWQRRGWRILLEELPRQVYGDGVDFEGSVPYHRLVLELFVLPALFRELCGRSVPREYRDRMIAMARFVAVYTRPDGTAPVWGDADDGRALPFGGQHLNDHRYLLGLVGAAWQVPDLIDAFSGSRSEVFWLLGPSAAASLPDTDVAQHPPGSTAFPVAGFYVMRGEGDYVLIDCGPVGLAGRGGHGHNDCLSFEAVLDGVHLVVDRGAYVYTASWEERNRFRSTRSHNTPMVDGQEINRFVHPRSMWALRYDAVPEVRRWETVEGVDTFVGAHAGYRRLQNLVTPVRTLVLDRTRHLLTVQDAFEGNQDHSVAIPLHLAPGVEVLSVGNGIARLSAAERHFAVTWSHPDRFTAEVERDCASPSYGVLTDSMRLVWRCKGPLDQPLTVCLASEECMERYPADVARSLRPRSTTAQAD